MSGSTTKLVVGLGEALFDVFDSGPRLGGAPLNVAVHAGRLLGDAGEGVVVSRAGRDQLGARLMDELVQRGMTRRFVQEDDEHPTGRVDVARLPDGGHTFSIAGLSAWDFIELTPELQEQARGCAAVVFGSLAQRHPVSRAAIQGYVGMVRDGIKLYDVNLRSSDGVDYYNRDILHESCSLADIVKMNDEEVETVCGLLGVAGAEGLLDTYDLRSLILTRGAKGTAAVTRDGLIEGEAVSYEAEDGSDTVGAGDACSAGLVSSLVLGLELQEALNVANRLGAFVASRVGATPDLPDDLIQG